MPTDHPLPLCVIRLDGALQSKSNFRRTRTKGSKSGEWRRHAEFEEELAILARQARPLGWPLGDREAALTERPDVVVLIAATSLLDTANMAKSVTDALEGVLFHNDASVRHVACVSKRSRKDQSAYILVAALEARSSMGDIFAAADVLAKTYQELAQADEAAAKSAGELA